MEELKLLKWAASAPEDIGNCGGADWERLFALLRAHNLVSRFHYRCREEKPPWYGHALSVPLWSQARAIEAHAQRQITAMREIADALPSDARPLIVIKGPATYATTGDRRHRRYSGDMDLLCRDPQRLWQTLRELGYQGDTKTNSHELSEMRRGGLVVEIHNYFPVASYPDAVRRADFVPARHPGHWAQPPPVLIPSRIDFDLLAAQSIHGVGPDTRPLRFPDPAASALILCAHEFRNFLHSPFTGMTVRLSALADVYDLARHPGFDAPRFLALMTQTGAQDSVAFTASLLQSFYGRSPLPVAAPPFAGARFPQALSYVGGWAALTEPDDLLLVSATETFVPALGANRLVATAEGRPPRLYATVPQSGPESAEQNALPRLILNAPKVPRLELSARYDADALRLGIAFQDPRPDECEDGAYIQTRHLYHGDAWACQFTDDPALEAPATALELSLRWSTLPRVFRQNARVPLLLMAGRFRREEMFSVGWINAQDVTPLAVLPLEIVCEA